MHNLIKQIMISVERVAMIEGLRKKNAYARGRKKIDQTTIRARHRSKNKK